MEIIGKITRVNYYNKDNGYSVLLITINKECYQQLHAKHNIFGNTMVVVGNIDKEPLIEEEYTFIGEFVKNPAYGLQFKFNTFKRSTNQSINTLITYLSSEEFKGIGIVQAKEIVEVLGSDCINIILNDPTSLEKTKLKKKNQQTVYQILLQNKKKNDNLLFLVNNGFTLEMSKKIIKVFEDDLMEVIKDNPYILKDVVERLSFKKNDEFALNIGISPSATCRLKAVIDYVLNKAIYDSGNCYLDIKDLFEKCNKYLDKHQISQDRFNEVIDILVNDHIIYKSSSNQIFDYVLYNKERELARIITNKLSTSLEKVSESSIKNAYKASREITKLDLSPLQEKAVMEAFNEPMLIITGGPGTGKTTIVRTILNMYVALHNNNHLALDGVALLAPTGKASKRLYELTNVQASTIHKFLGFTGNGFEYNKDNQRDVDFVIVDEASMMDLPLAYQLFSSTSLRTRFIIVGDVDQLPSVGPGQVLKDLIDSKEIKTIRLNQIHRQAQDSNIIKLAHNVNEGLLPENFLDKKSDCIIIPSSKDQIIPLMKEWINKAYTKGKNLTQDIQVLAPMYKCKNGIYEINQELQELVNPYTKDNTLKHNGRIFRINDKVIQLNNRSEKGIMNGDIGVIQSFTYSSGEINGLNVMFDIGLISYSIEDLDDLSLAYAISIHKSQGSEFDFCIIPVTTDYYYMFKRKIIYTAITRTKKCLVLIGDMSFLNNAIKNVEKNRLTILKDLLINGFNETFIIDDANSAFNTIDNSNDVNPYDFEEIPNILGEKEFEF